MKTARKVTVEVPYDLLRRAQDSTGKGITATIRAGLELVASARACEAIDLNGRLRDAALHTRGIHRPRGDAQVETASRSIDTS